MALNMGTMSPETRRALQEQLGLSTAKPEYFSDAPVGFGVYEAGWHPRSYGEALEKDMLMEQVA